VGRGSYHPGGACVVFDDVDISNQVERRLGLGGVGQRIEELAARVRQAATALAFSRARDLVVSGVHVDHQHAR